jgi:hypothetical protein
VLVEVIVVELIGEDVDNVDGAIIQLQITFRYLYVPGQGSPNIPLLLLILQLLVEHIFDICDVTLFKQFVLEEIPETKQVELSCLPKYAYEILID